MALAVMRPIAEVLVQWPAAQCQYYLAPSSSALEPTLLAACLVNHPLSQLLHFAHQNHGVKVVLLCLAGQPVTL